MKDFTVYNGKYMDENGIGNDLDLLTNTLDVLGLGHEVVDGQVVINYEHAKAEFVGLNKIGFLFNDGEFEKLRIEWVPDSGEITE